jgi:hypothetical protein
MIQGGDSVVETGIPAALTHKPELSGHDQAHALLAPVFVSGGYIGAAFTVGIDGHEQARRMILGQ